MKAEKRHLYVECELCSESHVQPDCVVCGGRGVAVSGVTTAQLDSLIEVNKKLKLENSLIKGELEKLNDDHDSLWQRVEEAKRVCFSGYTDRELEQAVSNL